MNAASTSSRAVGRRATAAIALATIAGCALPSLPSLRPSPAEPAITETAPGFFTLTKRAGFLAVKPAELRYDVEQQALAFCTARGKGLAVIQSTAVEAEGRETASASIEFRCA